MRLASACLLLELLADHVDLELGELVELELEDRVDLDLVELEPLHELLRGVLLAVARADDLDGLVERVEDRREAFEDVDALLAAASSWYSNRRVVVTSMRKSRKCSSISLMPHFFGCGGAPVGTLPSSISSGGTRQVMLTWKFVCSGVCL